MRVRCGECVFDSGARQVFRTGKPIHVSPKAFQLLEILIDRRPNAVSKEELHQLLWPNTFVSDANLPNLVAELRGHLGDDARVPRIIRTVQRFGYAFSGEAAIEAAVEEPASRDVVFKIVWADREFALKEGENILGRERDAAVWIDVYSISRRHARIVVSGDRALLEDLGSKNGTLLEGQTVTEPRSLSDGDRLRIGSVEMTVRRYLGGKSTESLRSG
jgi:DNA-binding winged helix-turn-helix (wHTH) protein